MLRSNDAVEGSLDDLLTALADPHRRAVAFQFADSPAPMALDDLVDDVVRTTACTDSAADVRVSLWHVHLPRLESVGLLTVDRSDRTVAPTVSPAELERCRRGLATLSGAGNPPSSTG